MIVCMFRCICVHMCVEVKRDLRFYHLGAICAGLCVCVHMHTCACVYIHVCIAICMCLHKCMCKAVCMSMDLCVEARRGFRSHPLSTLSHSLETGSLADLDNLPGLCCCFCCCCLLVCVCVFTKLDSQ